MRLGEDRSMDVETISTGSLSLDIALGAGGLPMGRIVEIYGPESSGKTTLTLQVIAAAQREGKTCAFIDAEHALDPSMRASLALISTTCCALSRIPVNKRWKSVMRWRAPVRLTLSLSTPLPH